MGSLPEVLGSDCNQRFIVAFSVPQDPGSLSKESDLRDAKILKRDDKPDKEVCIVP